MRAIEINLSDGSTLQLREPRADELPLFLRALPALTALGNALANQDVPGVILPVELSDEALDTLYPLLAKLTGMDGDAVRGLSMWDGMALLMGLQELIPANFTKAPPNSAST